MSDLKQKLQDINKLVEPVINTMLAVDVELKNVDLALYQVQSGGKRIRPALVILSGQLFGGDIKQLVYPAAAVEILHNSTLIIDDIIDHSLSRRDQPTCWNKYGQSIALCEALVYVASVYPELSKVNNGSKIIDLYSRTLKIIIDGEIKDILFERSGRDDEKYVVENRYKVITKADYLEMIGQKTAVLLQACCQAGAICAGASDMQIKIIGEFGFNLGMAFQIRDDILDIFGDEKEFGKKIGKDIIEKKMGNYVILSAVEKLKSTDKNQIVSILESSTDVSDQDVMIVTALIQKTDAKKDAEELSDQYIQTAFDQLEILPQNQHTNTLIELTDYIAKRSK